MTHSKGNDAKISPPSNKSSEASCEVGTVAENGHRPCNAGGAICLETPVAKARLIGGRCQQSGWKKASC